MHDQTSIERQWILLRTLVARRHGISVRDMAREAKVAEKTIRRDLQLFQKLGFPLLETNCERGRIPPVSVSATTRIPGMLPVSVSSTTHCRLEAASTRRQQLSTEGTERYAMNHLGGKP
jgi:DeoR-like helix-turn-helix domain